MRARRSERTGACQALAPKSIGRNAMTISRRSVNFGLAAALAAPWASRRAHAEAETIKIGMLLPVTGPAADAGKYSLARLHQLAGFGEAKPLESLGRES